MRTRVLMGILTFGLVAVVGCSKTLTDKSAARALQKVGDARQTAETQFVVDECHELLLETETIATAKCRVHVNLTEAGVAAWGSAPTEWEVAASFGKQPDGTWVATVR